ncbi:hypothetical protein C4J81_18045 [Deltaproteobacteria bacterium Smac51]|nr:hypothetical protein C4J81_18045 [Deltaproteobacteria bacterium Smac51]
MAFDRRREKCFGPVPFRGSLVTEPGQNISPGGSLVGFLKGCVPGQLGAGSRGLFSARFCD